VRQRGVTSRTSALLVGASIFIGAFDQAAIGVVLHAVTRRFGLSAGEVALVTTAAVAGMLVGGLAAGVLGDRFGRRRLLLAEVALLVVTSLGAGLATSFPELVAFRVVGGMAIGTGFTIAFVYLAEIAPEGSRGRWMSATLWGANFGMLVAYGLGAVLLRSSEGWRLLLATGAVFALPLVGLRRYLPETPAYARVEVARVGALLRRGLGLAKLRADLPALGAWFSYQVSDQGIALFLPVILAGLFARSPATGSALALGTKALTIPVSFVTILVIDRVGLKRLQAWGFLVRAVAFALVALIAWAHGEPLLALVVLAVAIGAGSAGPDKTTVIVPTGLASTELRATTQGVSQVAGRLGGIVGPALFVLADSIWGIPGGLAVFVVFSLVGALFTGMLPTRDATSGRAAS